MAKLADALALGASGEIHMGSSPFTRTINKRISRKWYSFIYLEKKRDLKKNGFSERKIKIRTGENF